MKAQANDDVVRNLNYLCRTYDGINKLIVSTKNRLIALNPDAGAQFDSILNGNKGIKSESQGLEQIKGRISRQIAKELNFFPIWTEWGKDVPGIGPSIAGHLILLYYYRFTAVCADCGGLLEKKPSSNGNGNSFVCIECHKKAKGDGVLTHRIDLKDFPNISGWWHYLGMHNVPHCPKCKKILKDVEGKGRHCEKCDTYYKGDDKTILYLKPKRQAGAVCNYSIPGRTTAYQIGDQFNRQPEGHLYKDFLLKERAKILKKKPEISKGHNLNMARNHTAKLFLSHFWQIARTLSGLPVTEPYVSSIKGHAGIIAPFYWKESQERSQAQQ